MLSKPLRSSRLGGGNFSGGKTIYCTIPYINADIPIAILFRALNQISDKEIIDKIFFNPEDINMINAIKPSLEEASPIQTRDDALSYIGSRGMASGNSREERIESA